MLWNDSYGHFGQTFWRHTKQEFGNLGVKIRLFFAFISNPFPMFSMLHWLIDHDQERSCRTYRKPLRWNPLKDFVVNASVLFLSAGSLLEWMTNRFLPSFNTDGVWVLSCSVSILGPSINISPSMRSPTPVCLALFEHDHKMSNEWKENHSKRHRGEQHSHAFHKCTNANTQSGNKVLVNLHKKQFLFFLQSKKQNFQTEISAVTAVLHLYILTLW